MEKFYQTPLSDPVTALPDSSVRVVKIYSSQQTKNGTLRLWPSGDTIWISYCLSFLFNVAGKKIRYTGDVGSSNDLYLFEKEIVDIYITETTHITLDEILQAAGKINPSKILLTHITEDDESKLQYNIDQLPEEAKKKLIIATDGLRIQL